MDIRSNVIVAVLPFLLLSACSNKFDKECVGTYIPEAPMAKSISLHLQDNHTFLLSVGDVSTQGKWDVVDADDFTLVKITDEQKKSHEFYYGNGHLTVLNPHLLVDSTFNEKLTLVKAN